ncbi:MAG: hypothetical protein ACTH85_12420 [Enterococcus faecalis]
MKIQTYLPTSIEEEFKLYCDENSLNQSKAVAELVTFALRVKSNSAKNDQVSNRKILEKILEKLYTSEPKIDTLVKMNFLSDEQKKIYDFKDVLEKTEALGTVDFLSFLDKK